MARNINSFKNDEKASKNTQNREKKNLKLFDICYNHTLFPKKKIRIFANWTIDGVHH